MKVVKKPKVWWQFTCNKCFAVCEAVPHDVSARPNIDSDGNTVGSIPVVACGYCGELHDVPEALLTPMIQEIAEAAQKR